MTEPPAHLSANVERFMGFADVYDAYRPRPPLAVLDILTQLAQAPQPALVVDLGSGTGLSTAIWAERAADGGRRGAKRGYAPPGRGAHRRAAGCLRMSLSGGLRERDRAAGWLRRYRDLLAVAALDGAGSTFAEIARILRPGGVFAAYDCDWPPTVNWAIEQAYQTFHGPAARSRAGARILARCALLE